MTAHAPERRSSGGRVVQNTILIILLAVVVGVGLVVTTGIRFLVDAVPTTEDIQAVFAPEPYEEIGPVVVESVKDLAELTTVEMVEYTIVEKGTDAGWLEWARGDSVRLITVAAIGGGVDLSGLEPGDFHVAGNGDVTVQLPAAAILYVDVDNEATEVLDRSTGLFTKGDPQLETEARQLAETVLVEQALEEGILEEAESNASTVITNLLQGLGYNEITVEFTST